VGGGAAACVDCFGKSPILSAKSIHLSASTIKFISQILKQSAEHPGGYTAYVRR
jgi:hypothetical protein